MTLTDIIRGILAPVVRVDDGGYWTRVTTPMYVACVWKDRGFYSLPCPTPTHTKVSQVRVGDIGFAFWREPKAKSGDLGKTREVQAGFANQASRLS